MLLLFAIFELKLQTSVRDTVVDNNSSSPLRSLTIMKGKLTPPLTKRPSEVGFWKLNEMPRSGGCLRQKKLIGYLR